MRKKEKVSRSRARAREIATNEQTNKVRRYTLLAANDGNQIMSLFFAGYLNLGSDLKALFEFG